MVAPPYVERLCVYLKELSTEEEILRTERKDHTYSPAPYPAEACAKDVYQMQKDSSTITFRFRELTLTSKMVFFFFFAQKIIIPPKPFPRNKRKFLSAMPCYKYLA